MKKDLTEIERTVVQLLTTHPPTTDLWGQPLHAVDKALGWKTTDSFAFVQSLLDRHLLKFGTAAATANDPVAPDIRLWWWKKGDARNAKDDAKSLLEAITKGVVTLLGLAYGTGFLVVFTFLDRFGIRETGGDFFKLRYIYIGGLCLAFPLFLAALLHGLSSMTMPSPDEPPVRSIAELFQRWRSAPKPPIPNLRALPLPSVLLILVLTIVSYWIIAFAPSGFYRTKLPFIVLLNLLILPQLFLRPAFGWRLLSWLPMTVRWLFLSAAVLLSAFVLLRGAPLAWIMTEGGINYVLLVTIMTVILHRFSGTLMTGQELRERIGRLAVRGAILGSLYLLTVFAFVHTVYNDVPAEKGGGDFTNTPDAKLCFVESARSSIPVGLAADTKRTPLCTVGVKIIIEETPSTVYVALASDRGSYSEKDYPNAPVLWRSGLYYPVVFGLSKATVAALVLNDGHAELSAPTTQVLPPIGAAGSARPRAATVPRRVRSAGDKMQKSF